MTAAKAKRGRGRPEIPQQFRVKYATVSVRLHPLDEAEFRRVCEAKWSNMHAELKKFVDWKIGKTNTRLTR